MKPSRVGGCAYSTAVGSVLFRGRISQNPTQVGMQPVPIIHRDVKTLGRGGRGAIACSEVVKTIFDTKSYTLHILMYHKSICGHIQ